MCIENPVPCTWSPTWFHHFWFGQWIAESLNDESTHHSKHTKAWNDEWTTGISYLVSKTIATVINKQIIREKNNPFLIHRNYTRYARANMHHGRHPKSVSLQSRFGKKTDNLYQYPGILPGHNIFMNQLNHLSSINIHFHSVYLKWIERCHRPHGFSAIYQIYTIMYIFYSQHRI
jgi:hypothetical protein